MKKRRVIGSLLLMVVLALTLLTGCRNEAEFMTHSPKLVSQSILIQQNV